MSTEAMFNRPDQPSVNNNLSQPWRKWYPVVQEQMRSATAEERDLKPWLRAHNSAAEGEVVVDKPFYKWLANGDCKGMYLCNQGS